VAAVGGYRCSDSKIIFLGSAEEEEEEENLLPRKNTLSQHVVAQPHWHGTITPTPATIGRKAEAVKGVKWMLGNDNFDR